MLASEQHLEQLIDALLALTRGQAGLERRERLDLAALTSQAMLAPASHSSPASISTFAQRSTQRRPPAIHGCSSA